MRCHSCIQIREIVRGQEPGDPVQFVARNALTKALGKNRVRGLEKSVPTLGFNSDNCSFYYATQ